jgi:micrococcal nuclease
LLTAKVTRVVDGDTLVVTLDGSSERIRLIGVDTPESVHPDASKNVPYGKIASDFTTEKLEGKEVQLELDVEERDKYGRMLAYVYLDGEMFNKTLLDEGHAVLATYPPNVKYVDIFTEAQKAAREAGRGLWGYDESKDPSSTGSESPSSGKSDGQTGNKAGNQAGNQAGGKIDSGNAKYIGTVNSYKFHYIDCEWGQKIAEHNAVYFATRDEAISAGFVPCKVCGP